MILELAIVFFLLLVIVLIYLNFSFKNQKLEYLSEKTLEKGHIHSWKKLALVDSLSMKEEVVLACDECGFISEKSKFLSEERLQEFKNKLQISNIIKLEKQKNIESLSQELDLDERMVSKIFDRGEKYALISATASFLTPEEAQGVLRDSYERKKS